MEPFGRLAGRVQSRRWVEALTNRGSVPVVLVRDGEVDATNSIDCIPGEGRVEWGTQFHGLSEGVYGPGVPRCVGRRPGETGTESGHGAYPVDPRGDRLRSPRSGIDCETGRAASLRTSRRTRIFLPFFPPPPGVPQRRLSNRRSPEYVGLRRLLKYVILPATAPLGRSPRCEILAESPIRLRSRALISTEMRSSRRQNT